MNKKNKSCRLLIIEDIPGDFFLLEQYLLRSQLLIEEIVHAESIAATASLVKNNFFDIVLLDLSLADSKGVDSVITLDRLLPQTPIIVFSDLSDVQIAIESISLGAQDYLIKGEFDQKLLVKSVQYSIERKKVAEKLRESNERFELASKATNDLIWDWNISTDEFYMGNSIIDAFGYEVGEFNWNWFLGNVHPEDREKLNISLQFHFEKNIRKWQDEYRFLSADGNYKEVFDRAYILFDEKKKPYRMIGAMTDVTERKRLERQLAEQQLKEQRLITEATIQGQEKERNELGRELHDNINQILATVKMYLGMVKSGQDITDDLVERSYEYVSEAMEEIRKLSHSLVAPSLGDIGLKEALQELAEETNLLNGLQLQLLVDEKYNEKGIDKNKELMLYRIVQEQLNNITKYAKAKEAVISLKKDNDNLFLSVADNGMGFDTTQKSKGIGLKNISNRVEFYSGNMNIISTPGQGCTLEVLVPC